MRAIIPFTLLLLFLNSPDVSLAEITQLPLQFVQLIPLQYLWVLRIPQAIIMMAVMYILVQKYFQDFRSQAILIFATTPWIIMISHEFAPVASLFLLGLSIYLAYPKKRIVAISLIGLIMSYLIIISFGNLQQSIHDKLTLLIKMLDLKTLFLQMEPVSSYLRIPRNGYFHAVMIVPFLFAVYQVINTHVSSMVKRSVVPVSMSTLFFLLYPSNHLVVAGSGFLLLYTLMINSGVRSLVGKNKFRFIAAVGVISISTVFFYDMYLRQFPVMYAGERSEAKFELVSAIITRSEKTIYLPHDREIQYIAELSKSKLQDKNIVYLSEQREWLEILRSCLTKEILCVLDEGTMKEYPVSKDDERILPLRMKNFLAVYYFL